MDPWLPRGLMLPGGGRSGSLLHDGGWFQIIDRDPGEQALIVDEVQAQEWCRNGLLAGGEYEGLAFGDRRLAVLGGGGRVLTPVRSCPRPQDVGEALAFAHAYRRTRDLLSDAALGEAVYCERYSVLLPPLVGPNDLEDELLIGRFLTGGVVTSCRARRRLGALVPSLDEADLVRVLEVVGLGASLVDGSPSRDPAASDPGMAPESGHRRPFTLVGRESLAAFFREHVIEIVQNRERYAALGVDFPGGIILHGAPGCGKTFAVERLVEYLDWPLFAIDASSIGSPFIHETSRKIAQVFARAMEASPAVVVIDEMDAFLAERGGAGEHRGEEVAEFLRRIPDAARNRVLLIGMTNRLDLIDQAVQRRGRFDHIIEVGMPTEAEVNGLLLALLPEAVRSADLDSGRVAQTLAGRPLSDVAFFAREAARLAGRAGSSVVTTSALAAALVATLARDQGRHGRIGFR